MRPGILTCVCFLACAASAGERVDDFGDNPGNLVVYEHVPAGALSPMPLVLLLHGCSQDAESYERGSGWLTLADAHGFALLSAEQSAFNNVGRCFNWFQSNDITRGQGEVASLASAVDYMLSTHDIDPGRVFVTGLSAGGAMSAAMLASYPELFAAGAIIGGVPFRCADNAFAAGSCMAGSVSAAPEEWGERVRDASSHEGPWPRVAIWHGDEDTTVHPANAAALEAQWRDVHGLEEADVSVVEEGSAEVRSFTVADEVVLERWMLAGIGHAVAVDPDEGCGALEPFFADADLCSTREIARFFRLLDADPSDDAGAGDGSEDAGSGREDAGSGREDAGSGREDAGSGREDAGNTGDGDRDEAGCVCAAGDIGERSLPWGAFVLTGGLLYLAPAHRRRRRPRRS